MLCMNQGSKKERVNILNLFKVNDTWRGGIEKGASQLNKNAGGQVVTVSKTGGWKARNLLPAWKKGPRIFS